MSEVRNILVVANETVAGQDLIDAVQRHTDAGAAAVHVICPQSSPRHGYVIYEGSVRAAAENRLEMTIAQLREVGIEATGEVMDPDPFSAIKDAIGERDYDEIIISTHPETRSGWLRQDLVTRVRAEVDCPVEHIVVDIAAEDGALRTLVVANQTVGGKALIDQLKALSEESPHSYVVICPQSDEHADEAEAQARLAHTLEVLDAAGLEAIGQIAHPDPFTAVKTALDFYNVDEIVISTFPETRSGWLREDLVGRLRASVDRPIHHVVSDAEPSEVEG